MSSQRTQDYTNHVKRPTALIVQALCYLLAAVLAGIVLSGSSEDATRLLLASAVAILAITSITATISARHQATTLQDRIIRLEMRLRLERLLPQELRSHAAHLNLGQLIALRFASDAELPALVQRVLDRELTGKDAIKRAVQDWQADHLRV